MSGKMIEKNTKFLLLCAVATASIVATLSVLFYPVENPDCAARYALMADAFARGDSRAAPDMSTRTSLL